LYFTIRSNTRYKSYVIIIIFNLRGFTNRFLINIGHEIALKYNGIFYIKINQFLKTIHYIRHSKYLKIPNY